jgi:hypothetical protein
MFQSFDHLQEHTENTLTRISVFVLWKIIRILSHPVKTHKGVHQRIRKGKIARHYKVLHVNISEDIL